MSTPVSVRHGGEDHQVREMPRLRFKVAYPSAYAALEKSEHIIPAVFFVSKSSVAFIIEAGIVPLARVWNGSAWEEIR